MAFVIVAPLICFLIIEICGCLQYIHAIRDINSTMDVVGRSASICKTKEDAEMQARIAALSATSNPDILSITTEIEYVDEENAEWTSGTLFVVRIYAEIKTVSLLFNPSAKTDRITAEYERKNFIKEMIYTVEGNSRQSELRQQMVNYAMKFVGVSKYYDNPYEQENDPVRAIDKVPGDPVDCSMLIQAIYHHFGIMIERAGIADQGNLIQFSEAQPGDIIYYPAPSPNAYAHVTMYIGNNQMVEARDYGEPVCVSTVRPGYTKVSNIIDKWEQ